MNLEFQKPNEMLSEVSEPMKDISSRGIAALGEALAIVAIKISQMPEVRKAINEKIEELKSSALELGERVITSVTSVLGQREMSKELLELPNPNAYQFPRSAEFSEKTVEGREFGIKKCTDAALRIFNPGVLAEWKSLTKEERIGVALEYAEEVAKAFELENYKGVFIERLERGVRGYNNGDGTIHLSVDLVAAKESPLQLMDTITHELRHQYQSECVAGFHDVPNEVRVEWAMAQKIYNYNEPSCYDPWGYKYNPLEIDARFAGMTTVRNYTNFLFNELAKA